MEDTGINSVSIPTCPPYRQYIWSPTAEIIFTLLYEIIRQKNKLDKFDPFCLRLELLSVAMRMTSQKIATTNASNRDQT